MSQTCRNNVGCVFSAWTYLIYKDQTITYVQDMKEIHHDSNKLLRPAGAQDLFWNAQLAPLVSGRMSWFNASAVLGRSIDLFLRYYIVHTETWYEAGKHPIPKFILRSWQQCKYKHVLVAKSTYCTVCFPISIMLPIVPTKNKWASNLCCSNTLRYLTITCSFVNTIQQQTIYFGRDILWWQSILEGRTPVSLKLMNVHSCSLRLPWGSLQHIMLTKSGLPCLPLLLNSSSMPVCFLNSDFLVESLGLCNFRTSSPIAQAIPPGDDSTLEKLEASWRRRNVKGHGNNSMLLIAERTGSGPGHYDCKEMQRVSNCKKCSLCRGHQAHRDTSDTKDLSRVSDCSMFHGCTRGYGWGEWRITFVEYSSYASGRTLNLYLSRYSCMSSHPRLYCQQINFSTPYPTYQSKSVKIKDLCIDTYRYGSICALKYWLLPSAMHCCVERSSHVMQGRHVCRLPLNK